MAMLTVRGLPDIHFMKAANAFVFLLAVACAPALLAQGAGEDCLVASEAGRLPDGVRAIKPAEADRKGTLRISCRAGHVSELSIRLAPGGSAQARILLVGDSEHGASLAAEGGLPKAWSSLSARRLDARTTLLTLSIAAPGQLEAGSGFSDRLGVTAAGLELDIPIHLEIVRDDPLFKDDFGPGPDPVIGQFSLVM